MKINIGPQQPAKSKASYPQLLINQYEEVILFINKHNAVMITSEGMKPFNAHTVAFSYARYNGKITLEND